MKYHFSNYTFDTKAHSLTQDGLDQPVEPQVFDLLRLMLENAGKLVTKDQLIEEIWGGRIVSESAISARIAATRKVVGDDGKRQEIIRTIARRGIQFVAQVTESGSTEAIPHSAEFSPKIRYATADDGVKIAFAISGSGPPLLRVAHHPTHLELEWNEASERSMFDVLGQSHTLIRMDQRGCGLSDLDVDDFSTTRSAKDMKAVLDVLGINRVDLLGTSSGGMIATEFAAMFPERSSRLITLGGYVDGRSVRNENASPDPDDAILKMAKEGWETHGSSFISGYVSVYFPTATPELIQQIARNVQLSCPVENEIRGRRFFNHHSIANLLEKVQAPTLIMHSRGDAVHPLSEGQKLAKGISGAQLLVLESRNHYPLQEEESWQTMMAAMQEFLAD
ncbi:MAG: alpha/beta fold hydrolase [Rhizobiaceae bacterium]